MMTQPPVTPPTPTPTPPAPDPIPPEGQAFHGEEALEAKLAGRDLTDRVLIIDGSYGTSDTRHYDRVVMEMTNIGIPAGVIGGNGR